MRELTIIDTKEQGPLVHVPLMWYADNLIGQPAWVRSDEWPNPTVPADIRRDGDEVVISYRKGDGTEAVQHHATTWAMVMVRQESLAADRIPLLLALLQVGHDGKFSVPYPKALATAMDRSRDAAEERERLAEQQTELSRRRDRRDRTRRILALLIGIAIVLALGAYVSSFDPPQR